MTWLGENECITLSLVWGFMYSLAQTELPRIVLDQPTIMDLCDFLPLRFYENCPLYISLIQYQSKPKSSQQTYRIYNFCHQEFGLSCIMGHPTRITFFIKGAMALNLLLLNYDTRTFLYINLQIYLNCKYFIDDIIIY